MKKFMAALAVVALVAFAAPAFAATNPFMDVPAGHWAYDAVAQLASRGVASGYPDGSYKGAQPATRYEMASMVARALAQMDMEKASKQDVELLKRLVLEFKNELDALGVKVNDLDKRVAVLEDGIGGWKIRGIFQFDAKFADSDNNDSYLHNSNGRKNEFDKERFRLFLTKQINEDTYFYAQYRTGGNSAGGHGRGDQQHMRWSHMYVDTKLPWDFGLRIGRFGVDFEDDYGLYADEDALFGDFRIDGFQLTKNFGIVNATAIIGRNSDYDDFWGDITEELIGVRDDGVFMTYILDLNVRPNEKFFAGATGYWMIEDSSLLSRFFNLDIDINTYAIYAGYNFTPAIGLKGIYYFQDLGNDFEMLFGDDSPKAWKAILDVKQEALKFTSLWVEYSQQDNRFISPAAWVRYGIGGSAYASVMDNIFSSDPDEKTNVWFVKAVQQWNDKWSTQLRFAHADFNTEGLDNATEWGVGVGYQYTPAIYFELLYDQIDYGNGAWQDLKDKESVFRFRTSVSF